MGAMGASERTSQRAASIAPIESVTERVGVIGYRDGMAESASPGLGDLLGLFGGANPFASIGKTIEQFKRGVNDFLAGVETFKATMESLNGVTIRVNRLLDEVEEPVRALMPQVTRSIKTADAVIAQLSGPVERIAPGLSRLAETLGSPVFLNLPREIGGFIETLGDLAMRLQPLTQMAESAGSLFGLRPLSVLRGGQSRPQSPAPPATPPASAAPATQPANGPTPRGNAPSKDAADKVATSKKTAPTKSPARNATAPKKSPATKSPATKATSRQSPAAKKTATTKTATTNTATKKTAARASR